MVIHLGIVGPNHTACGLSGTSLLAARPREGIKKGGTTCMQTSYLATAVVSSPVKVVVVVVEVGHCSQL